MDYVNPKELLQDALVVAEKKASLSISDMLMRGALSGVFLGFATSLAVVVTTQGVPPVVGAILFPAGFVILALLGLELATGNFALLPIAVTIIQWFLWNQLPVTLGNIVSGALFTGLALYATYREKQPVPSQNTEMETAEALEAA
jgi:formate transporter